MIEIDWSCKCQSSWRNRSKLHAFVHTKTKGCFRFSLSFTKQIWGISSPKRWRFPSRIQKNVKQLFETQLHLADLNQIWIITHQRSAHKSFPDLCTKRFVHEYPFCEVGKVEKISKQFYAIFFGNCVGEDPKLWYPDLKSSHWVW